MQKVENKLQKKLKKFDKWLNNITFGHYSQIKTLKKLENMTNLEDQILEWTERNLIPEVLTRREFLAMMMRESGLRILLKNKRENLNPQSNIF